MWQGAVAGAFATGAYDLARYGVVAAWRLTLSPFHVWRVFGELFLGPQATPSAKLLAGIGYHVTNGIGFGAAFSILVGCPTWWKGVIWGLMLELAMASLYPSWLRIEQLREFLSLTAVGHVVYGATLGIMLAFLRGRAARTQT